MVVATVRSRGGATVAGSGGTGSVSRVTLRTTVLVFPAASVAATVMMLPPGASAKGVENAPKPLGVIGVPFTVTVRAVPSVTVPATSIASSITMALSTGALTVSAGAVVSRTTVRVIVAVLPAASVATNVNSLTPTASGIIS